MQQAEQTTGKPRPRLFRALGKRDAPQVIDVLGEQYQLIESLKHDSWAATAIYEGEAGKLICKFNRQQSIFGFPMKWLGRRLARRETKVMQIMADCRQIPDDCGRIYANGKYQDNASGHIFIPGRPMAKDDVVGDDFFPKLRKIIEAMHARDIAYVDLNKSENIIVGDDGDPYMVDFQISFMLPLWWPANWIMRGLLYVLQQSDIYHFMKHYIRLRKDQLPPEQQDINRIRPPWIRAWRQLATPFRETRRRLLVLLGIRKGSGKSTSEHDPEDAVRRAMQTKAVATENTEKDS